MTTATITNNIPDEITIDEITTSTKLTQKQADLLKARTESWSNHLAGDIAICTRSGYEALTTQHIIDTITKLNEASSDPANEKASIRRAIANMQVELNADYRRLNRERNSMIEQLQHAARWTDDIKPGTKTEMSHGTLTIRLTDLNRQEMSWYSIDSVSIDAEIELDDDGLAYTRYFDTNDWRREWSVTNTVDEAIEQAITRLLARHAAKTAEAYQRKIAAQATLAAAGIAW